ncbi:MAG TPA: YetF domain-containing protein [Anaerolineaceae bacterium]
MTAQIWNDLFNLTLPVLEKMLRPVIIYLFLVVGLRLAGKRELASLNPFDLVVLLTISNTVQNAIIGDDNTVLGGVIGAVTLLVVNYVVLRLIYRHPKIDSLLEGDPEVLVDHGVMNKKAMDRQLISIHELEIAANKQGFESLEHIQRAILEPGGSIFFVEKEPSAQERRLSQILTRLERIEKSLGELHAQKGAGSR